MTGVVEIVGQVVGHDDGQSQPPPAQLVFQRAQLGRHAHQTGVGALHPDLLPHPDLHIHMSAPAPGKDLARLVVGGLSGRPDPESEAEAEAESGQPISKVETR